MAQKPWGGRFEADTDKSVEDFTTSLSFDRRLYRQDIAGSIAHARMLAKQGINVARRTVAKYREAMSIPPSNERKRIV